MENNEPGWTQRSVIVRVLCGTLWLIPVYLVTHMAVGAIVGGIAGAGTPSYEAGYAAGHEASLVFFQRYGTILLAGEVLLTAWLSLTGVLPGTGKWKKA